MIKLEIGLKFLACHVIKAATVIDDIYATPAVIDRGDILTTVLRRQALRREARLPLLDVRAEYYSAVEKALWRYYVECHHDRVRGEILAQQRARHGEGWGYSWGGRMALTLLTDRALRANYSKP